MKINFPGTITTIILFSLTTLMLVGCKKEKDPIGEADFTYELLPMGGIKVTFTGTGIPVSWNFGGAVRVTKNNVHSFVKSGEVSVGAATKEITAYFEKDGAYNITLRSQLNSTSAIDEKSLNIQISGTPNAFILKRVTLLGFSPYKLNGTPWDNGLSGPDITFAYQAFGVANPMLNYISPTHSDITTEDLPINHSLSPALIFTFAELGWYLSSPNDTGFYTYAIEDSYEEGVGSVGIKEPMKNEDAFPYPTTFKAFNTNGDFIFETEVEWITR